jgi:hypothetical protein
VNKRLFNLLIGVTKMLDLDLDNIDTTETETVAAPAAASLEWP